jgi:hypothetical protein
MEGEGRMGDLREMLEDVHFVLSKEERAVVKKIRSMRPGEHRIDWKTIAKNLQVAESYLKAICSIPLPESNMISMRELECAKFSVALDAEEGRSKT